ncbi:hypothetical protein CRENBAI_012576 [Crenichthys baileyi]|uniref:Uncharacterized protein n=1 Tax=Crenichthys baileyi TaxID=28760 RepID=A0AAV9SRN5_9TELE
MDIVEENIRLESSKEVLVADFNSFSLGNVSVGAGGDAVGAQGKASGKNEDSTSPATLMSEGIRQQDLTDLILRPTKIKVKPGTEKKLKLAKGEKLAFVQQRVYNTNSVKFESKTSTSWSIGAKFWSFIPGCSESEKTKVTTFTVPENKVFGFALKEFVIKDGFLDIDAVVKMQGFSATISRIQIQQSASHLDLHPSTINAKNYSTEDQKSSETSEVHVCVNVLRNFSSILVDEIKSRGKVLEPLGDLCGSTRRDLLKKLSEILEDRDALALLEDTLDHCSDAEYQRPKSKAVASFMDLLNHSKVSRDVTEAVHLLVCALEGKCQVT